MTQEKAIDLLKAKFDEGRPGKVVILLGDGAGVQRIETTIIEK